MAKKRVHEIAKDLGFQNRDLIEKLQKLGFEVKSHSSTVDEEDVRRALKKEDEERRARTDERRVSRQVIRRRSASPEGEAGASMVAEEAPSGVSTPPPPPHEAPSAGRAAVAEVEPAAVPAAHDGGEGRPKVVIRRERKEAPPPVAETAPAAPVAPAAPAAGDGARAAPAETPPPPAAVEAKVEAPSEVAPATAAAPTGQAVEAKIEGPPPAQEPAAAAAPAAEAAAPQTAAPAAAEAAPAAPGEEEQDKKDRRDRTGRADFRKREEEYDEDDDKPDLQFEDVGISEQDFQVESIERALDKTVRVAPPPPSTKPAALQKEEEGGSKIVRTIDPNVLKARLASAKRPEPPKDWGKENVPASPLTELVVRTDASGKRKELVDVRKEAAKGGRAGRTGQRKREEMSAKDLLEHRRGQVYYPTPSRKRIKGRKGVKRPEGAPVGGHKPIEIGETITVADLAKQMGRKATEIIGFLMREGVMASINQSIPADVAENVAVEFGFDTQSRVFDEEAHMSGDSPEEAKQRAVSDPDAELRAPVVTVMGHVDHGKTTLLDRIRKSNVAAGEAGGITQRIAGYQVKTGKGSITFLDTPGHVAFREMRARGANVTDIVILVVAADDGVMPQTLEAIEHAKGAGVPIIIAVNKIDKPDSNPERVLQQLSGQGLVVEEWGGDVLSRRISAKTGDGVDDLLELIALQAEIMELKANPKLPGVATVIEAAKDPGRGPVATVLVREGTLRVGDAVVVGECVGKVRAMLMDGGRRVADAGPSTPVEILGLDGVPNPGDDLRVAKSLDAAREIASHREEKRRSTELAGQTKVTLQEFLARMADHEQKELKVIIKADVQGSVEALRASLMALSTGKVRVNVIQGGVGAVVESDVEFARTSEAIIIGFGVRPDTKAVKAARSLGVDIRSHSIIYDAVDEVRLAMEGLLAPITQEKYLGRAEVRQTFTVPKVGTVAGCAVVDGEIKRSAQIRVIRDGKEIYVGKLASLKRFKDDVREVREGLECGMGIEKFNDVKVGDIIEAFEMIEVKAALDTAPTGRSGSSSAEARP